MSETKLGFVAQIKSFPRTFWVANTMEIFERLAWYGWFGVSALYITAPTEAGGLGFTTEVRGALQGIIPFFLYLFPVVTGALADRFGFKRMFIIAYCVMIVSYYSLGQFTSLPTFFMAFMFVAIGAAIFKPVVVGTVARMTDESNSSLGFGVFYMMVNIGGAVGPIIAGIVRGWSWDYVFMACSFWSVLNLIIVVTLYKSPPKAEGADDAPSRSWVDNAIEVLGNFRFFLTVGFVLIALMLTQLLPRLGPMFEWVNWYVCALVCIGWLVVNFVYDAVLPKGRGVQGERAWFSQRMHCSNWRFALFLLIMSGFWTAFNQIFITLPEYVRDFTETRPLITAFESVFGESDPEDPSKGVGNSVATVSDDERGIIALTLEGLVSTGTASGGLGKEQLEKGAHSLIQSKVRLTPKQLEETVIAFKGHPVEFSETSSATFQKLLTTFKSRERGQPVDGALEAQLERGNEALRASKLHLSLGRLEQVLLDVKGDMGALKSKLSVEKLTEKVIIRARQFNPEFVMIINAAAIIFFQIFVSLIMGRFHRFTTMIVGMVVAGVGIGLSMFAGGAGTLGLGGSAYIVCMGLFIFSFGEMMASPTSQEYVGRIAPEDKKALYMGYYFVAIALGNLFGGILSGQFYGTLARDMQRPDLMWMAFGLLMFGTALVFVLYNRFALPKSAAGSLTDES